MGVTASDGPGSLKEKAKPKTWLWFAMGLDSCLFPESAAECRPLAQADMSPGVQFPVSMLTSAQESKFPAWG